MIINERDDFTIKLGEIAFWLIQASSDGMVGSNPNLLLGTDKRLEGRYRIAAVSTKEELKKALCAQIDEMTKIGWLRFPKDVLGSEKG